MPLVEDNADFHSSSGTHGLGDGFTPATVKQNLDLGVIGNCSFAALVDRNASIVWTPLPHFDGDPVFCSLLRGNKETGEAPTDGLGDFGVSLRGHTRSRQYYIKNTAVLVTELIDDNGDGVSVTDFAPRFQLFGRTHRPGQIIRILKPIGDVPRITIRCKPMCSHGSKEPETMRGSNSVRFQVPGLPLRLTADCPVGLITDEVEFVLDREVCLIFGPDESLTSKPSTIANEFLSNTVNHWREFARSLHIPFEWQREVIRAAITLKLCSFEETGAIVAAMTTSIPEFKDSGRNWDYTKTWLRDSYFTVNTLNRLGSTKTMEGYLGFITNVIVKSKDGYLQPLFGIYYQEEIEEWISEHLTGYRGMGPVRFGNAAYTQVQNDSYGAVILAITQSFFDERLEVRGNDKLFSYLEALGEQARKRYNEVDAGLWELRGSKHIHTFSSVMCWAACDRLALIARKIGKPDRGDFWEGNARKMREEIIERTWNATLNTFTDIWDGDDVDSCLLLLSELGFIEAMDKRYIGTVEAIERKLRHGGHLFRYAKADDFGLPETAFNICTFWFISALAKIGRRDEAREMFEGILGCRNSVGLLSEDIDTNSDTDKLWGNFPQSYSMVGIIDCALLLSKPWCSVEANSCDYNS